MSSKLIYKNLGKDLFQKATKITIERDPLDFLISMYYYDLRKINSYPAPSFKEWLAINYKLVMKNYNIAPKTGKYKADIILKYENLNEEIFNCKALPEDFLETFKNLKAKSNFRSQKKITPEAFFKENNCQEWINKVYQLTETNWINQYHFFYEKLIRKIKSNSEKIVNNYFK
jgi:hypothetical protein